MAVLECRTRAEQTIECGGRAAADHMAQHTDGDLFWWIARGIPGTPMPAFGDSLNEEERWHLVNYIRSLRQRAGLRTQD